jgi:hypothetical protein
MSFTGTDVDQDAQVILTDPFHLTWTEADILRAINSAVRETVSLVPAAASFKKLIPLTAMEARQSLPPDVTRIMHADRNNTAAGTAPGRPVRAIDRSQLELYDPTWTASGPAAAIRHIVYDENNPGEFWVWPRLATSGMALEATVNGVPPSITSLVQTVPVGDIYRNAILNYTLAYCYMKNQEDANAMSTAAAYFQLAGTALGVKNQVDQKLAI